MTETSDPSSKTGDIRASDLHLDDFSTRKTTGSQPAAKYYGEALLAAARANPAIIALSGDLTPATETDLIRDALPEQFIMAGIAEANMVGVAAGLARAGMMPFVHSFSVFLSRRSFDQIAMQVAYPRTNVKLIGFMPGIDSLLGVSHQAIDDLALMRALPNMTVIEPAGPAEYSAAVAATIAHEGPVYLRLYRSTSKIEETDGPPPALKIGHMHEIRQGKDVAIIACGLMVERALQAAAALAAEDISAAVLNAASIKPFDRQSVIALANRFKGIITAENHTIIGGLGSAVAEVLAETGSSCTLRRVGLDDCFAEGGSRDYLFRKYGLDAEHICTAARNLLNS